MEIIAGSAMEKISGPMRAEPILFSCSNFIPPNDNEAAPELVRRSSNLSSLIVYGIIVDIASFFYNFPASSSKDASTKKSLAARSSASPAA